MVKICSAEEQQPSAVLKVEFTYRIFKALSKVSENVTPFQGSSNNLKSKTHSSNDFLLLKKQQQS